jgi:heme oxygenase
MSVVAPRAEPAPAPSPAALSAELQRRTAAAHERAERRPFFGALLAGELPLAAYVDLLVQLRHLYAAFEAGDAAVVARGGAPALLDARLHRTAHVDADLDALGDVAPAGAFPLAASASSYAAAVLADAATDLPAYVGHHYTRYLGDLSGGRLIARCLADRYGLREDQLAVHRFDGITPVPFKRWYRAELDALPWHADQREAAVAAAGRAFAATADLVDELWARHGS